MQEETIHPINTAKFPFEYRLRSFNAHHIQLTSLLSTFKTQPDIIILCETWLSKQTMTTISGYRNFDAVRVKTRGGGLKIAISDNLAFESIIQKAYAFFSALEYLVIQCDNLILIAICRPPSGSFSEFFDYFQDLLLENCSDIRHIIIVGDWNFDIFEENNVYHKIYNIIMTFGLKIVRDYPTYFQARQPHQYDFFITSYNSFDSTVIHSDISDYLPIILTIHTKDQPSRSSSQTYTYRRINDATERQFSNLLTNVDWAQILVEKNIDLLVS